MAVPSADLGVLQVIIATGLLTAISETVRWVLGRGKSRVDDAKVVQGMALDLLAPLRSELDRAETKVTALSGSLDDILAWAMMAKALLDAGHIAYPPVPATMAAKPNGTL